MEGDAGAGRLNSPTEALNELFHWAPEALMA
jgi:hypothetical protein